MGKNNMSRIQDVGLLQGALAVLIALAACIVHSGHGEAADPKKAQGNEPIIITSQSLVADNNAKTATFTGNVIARKGEATLYSDKMIVYSRKDPSAPGETVEKAKSPADSDKGDIEKIEADGSVRLVKGTRVITSKFATYYSDPEERVVFTGEPKAAEGQNVVTGTKMTYFMKDDRSLVENSKVFLVNKERKPADSAAKKSKVR